MPSVPSPGQSPATTATSGASRSPLTNRFWVANGLREARSVTTAVRLEQADGKTGQRLYR